MTSLSPAAQAVLDEVLYKMCAGESESYAQMIAAAALRAAADQVVPEPLDFISPGTASQIRIGFFAIAAELERQHQNNHLVRRTTTVADPTDQDLLELMPETMRDEFGYAAKVCSDATGGQVKPGIFRVCLNHTALEYARAVLNRYAHTSEEN